MLARLARVGFVAALVISNALAANVFIVGTGPGATHADIQSAVWAATDGDVILVRTGSYPSFEVLAVDVSIVADTGADVRVDGAIRIAGIPATRTVLVSGLRVTGAITSVPDTTFGLHCSGCFGAVRLQDCQFVATVGSGPCGLRADGAWVESCADVSFTRCELRGASEYFDWEPNLHWSERRGGSGMGLYANGSSVAAYDCNVVGGTGVPAAAFICAAGYGYYDGGNGGHAARLESAFLCASGTTFTGGDGGAGQSGVGWCTWGGNGGAGLQVVSGPPSLVVGCALVGGRGALEGAAGLTSCNSYRGHDGPPFVAPALSQPAVVSQAARRCVVPRIASDAGAITLTFTGRPAEVVRAWTTTGTRWRYMPSAFGVRLPYDSPVAPLAMLGTLSTGGTLTRSWFLPQLPPGEHARRVFFQPVFEDGLHGIAHLGTPNALVIVDHNL